MPTKISHNVVANWYSMLAIIDKLTPDLLKEIDDAMGTKPRMSREMSQSRFRHRSVRHSKL